MKKILLSITALFILAIGIAQNNFHPTASPGFNFFQSANTKLSNLSPGTAINRSLLPNKDAKKDLGSTDKKWRNLFLSGNLKAGFITTDSISAGLINVTGGGVNVTNADLGFNVSNSHIGLNATATYGVYSIGLFMGAYGESNSYYGLYGTSRSGTGVYGTSDNYYGINGNSSSFIGVNGYSFTGIGGNFSSDSSYGIMAATKNGTYAGVFNGNVLAYGTYQTSDKNLKKNIENVDDAMNIINKLKPKNYEFINDGKYAVLHLPTGRHYGLLAQDLEEVLPNLVKETPLEMTTRNKTNASLSKLMPGQKISLDQDKTTKIINAKAVNYIELIPIIIKGMQELNDTKDKKINDLQSQLNAQQVQIDELKNLVQSITKHSGTILTNPGAYIKQNSPNPSKDNTVISYFTPNDTRNAQILVSNINGTILKTYTISKGEGQVNIKSGELPAGSYNYTLYVNSNKIDTRQLIIVK